MTKNEVFESDRNEEYQYRDALEAYECDHDTAFESDVPITRSGFEALTAVLAEASSLPLDDEMRKLVCGFVHCLDRKTAKFEFKSLVNAAFKQYSNHLTAMIDHEIDLKIRAERENQELSLVPPQETTTNETETNH